MSFLKEKLLQKNEIPPFFEFALKRLLHGLHTIHANLTAMNGTGFLILDCSSRIFKSESSLGSGTHEACKK